MLCHFIDTQEAIASYVYILRLNVRKLYSETEIDLRFQISIKEGIRTMCSKQKRERAATISSNSTNI